MSPKVGAGSHRVQKIVSDPLEMQLQRVVGHLTWAMGINLGFSRRTTNVLHCGAISSASRGDISVTFAYVLRTVACHSALVGVKK